MARTLIQGRNALIAGIDCAPGRASAQQLSRSGSGVFLGSRDEDAIDRQGENLKKKGGSPTGLILPRDREHFEEAVRRAREAAGHIHLAVNALAFCYADEAEAERALIDARALDAACATQFAQNGPLRLLTLWPAGQEVPEPAGEDLWHGYVVLGPLQRLDTERVDELDATGTRHLRAGAVADAVVALLQVPPSIRPRVTHLEAIVSAEKKG